MVLNSIQPDKSAVSSESILSASNTSKSVLFTWMVLFTTPVLDVVTAWQTRTLSAVLVGCFFFKNQALRACTHPVGIQHPVTVHGELVLVVALGQIHDGHKVVLTAVPEVSVSDSAHVQRASMSSHTFGLRGFWWPSC